MFRKTIAVGPLELVASCVTGGAAVAKPDLRHLLYSRYLLPNRTELALLRRCRASTEGLRRVIARGPRDATCIEREEVYNVQQGTGKEKVGYRDTRDPWNQLMSKSCLGTAAKSRSSANRELPETRQACWCHLTFVFAALLSIASNDTTSAFISISLWQTRTPSGAMRHLRKRRRPTILYVDTFSNGQTAVS